MTAGKGFIGLEAFIFFWMLSFPVFVSAGKVLVFNPQPESVLAGVSFSPAEVGLKGVPADRVVVSTGGKEVASQVEDADLDGKFTDGDAVFVSVLFGPGNTWLEVKQGQATAADRKISVQKVTDRWRTGGYELAVKSGRPVRFLAGTEWKEVKFDFGTPVGGWGNSRARRRCRIYRFAPGRIF